MRTGQACFFKLRLHWTRSVRPHTAPTQRTGWGRKGELEYGKVASSWAHQYSSLLHLGVLNSPIVFQVLQACTHVPGWLLPQVGQDPRICAAFWDQRSRYVGNPDPSTLTSHLPDCLPTLQDRVVPSEVPMLGLVSAPRLSTMPYLPSFPFLSFSHYFNEIFTQSPPFRQG